MTTQALAFGAFSGRRYGSFAGRGVFRDVAIPITSPRAFGAMAGMPYGEFAGRVVGRPLQQFTTARAFGAMAGSRYGSFAGRVAEGPTDQTPTGGGFRIQFPTPVPLQGADVEIVALLAGLAAAGYFGRQ